MGRKPQKSTQVRLKAWTHARLQALAEIEDRDMNLVLDRVFTAYLKANHPELIAAHPEPEKPKRKGRGSGS
jgi:hypothetical protein